MKPKPQISCTANCLTCDSRFLHVFCNFHPEAFDDFAKLGTHVEHDDGAVLFRDGTTSDHVFMVCGGRVKLSVLSKKGHAFTFKIAGHGDLLGLSAVVAHTPYEATAVTLGPVQLKVIARADFIKFVEAFNEASSHTAAALAEQHQAAISDVRRLGLSDSAATQLAHVLLELKHSADPDPASLTFPLSLTHEEMADMAGTSRETVSRLMSQFRRDRLIVIKGVKVTILRPEVLEHLAL